MTQRSRFHVRQCGLALVKNVHVQLVSKCKEPCKTSAKCLPFKKHNHKTRAVPDKRCNKAPSLATMHVMAERRAPVKHQMSSLL